MVNKKWIRLGARASQSQQQNCAPVAQLDRARPSVGRGHHQNGQRGNGQVIQIMMQSHDSKK